MHAGACSIWGQALFACRGGGVGAVLHCGEEAGSSCCSGSGRAKAWGLPELPDVTPRLTDSLARTRYTIILSRKSVQTLYPCLHVIEKQVDVGV